MFITVKIFTSRLQVVPHSCHFLKVVSFAHDIIMQRSSLKQKGLENEKADLRNLFRIAVVRQCFW